MLSCQIVFNDKCHIMSDYKLNKVNKKYTYLNNMKS